MMNMTRKKKQINKSRILVLMLIIIAIIVFIITNKYSQRETKKIDDITLKDDISPVITLTNEKTIIVKRRKFYI